MEAYGVVRRQGSHILLKIRPQMAVSFAPKLTLRNAYIIFREHTTRGNIYAYT
jgi:hypothetical protein